ncbi:MAG: hypothetical protein GF334_06255 [Candidatus Altiarchaeales archaeon]|nr:hypothetical protein [Candidatus Altiarchaeales archaeon]
MEKNVYSLSQESSYQEVGLIFTIVSPDKLSLSMFLDYLLSVYKDTPSSVLDLNCLYSMDVQKAQMQDSLPKDPDHVLVIKYKIKKQTKYPIGLCSEVIDKSNHIISFDLFSTHPEIKKTEDEAFLKPLLERWEASVEKMNNV